MARGVSRYMKLEDGLRLDELAMQAGVGTSDFLATLVRAFGEQALELAVENKRKREMLEREAYRVRDGEQEGRAA